MNQSIMANLESIIENTGSRNLFRTVSAESGGVIVYSIDGYEDLTADTVTPSDFDKNKYTKTNLKAQELVVAGNPAYKLINNESWYILIPLTQSDIDKMDLTSKSTINIIIKKDNVTTTADF